MTPAERARLIEQQEFEAECRAARRHALCYAQKQRQDEAARIARWLGKELPPTTRLNLQAGRKPKRYEYNGVSKSLSEWAVEYRLPLKTLSNRIRSGMRFERALMMRPGERAEYHTINGVAKTLAGWADHIGISYPALLGRLRRGHTLAEAIAMPAGRWAGVSADLIASKGTGAWGTAQEIPEITFSEQAENT